MKKIFIPIILFLAIGINLSAQKISRREIKGDKLYTIYNYNKAIKLYKRTKHLSIDGQRRLAESYHNMNLNIKSEEIYSNLIINNGDKFPEDYYNYAMVLKTNGKYDESNKWMDKFSTEKPNDLRVKSYQTHKNDFANYLKDNEKYKIKHLSVNTNAEDFGTVYYKDKIVFSSTNLKPKMILRKDNWTGKPYWDMYVCDVENGELGKPKKFDKKLNGKLHDGPASFSKDGNYVAFTRNHYNDKSKDRVVELQIFFSSFIDGEWSTPESFPINNNDYSVGQPCLSADGNTMYFTSDMPGGFGGSDLYKSTKGGNGVWNAAENLGKSVNTEGDEMYPFFEEKNQVLFFTSNGHFGLGGLDIFISPMSIGGFGEVSNAGYPLNTPSDDFASIVSSDLKTGYFTSNRDGGTGGDDIYALEILQTKVLTEEQKIAVVAAIDTAITNENTTEIVISDKDVTFSVFAPKNIPIERKVRETFPLRNYIFFDLESIKIPERYVLLSKEQVTEFKEEQLEVYTVKTPIGRAKRQMVVYYNILNILGDRMIKNPTSTIVLVGSSEKGPEDGRLMGESVKKYLVDTFGINSKRITVEGNFKPKIPSEQPDATLELVLLREGDRRVSIESSSPALLMEFQSGPDAPLKPVEFNVVQEAPIDSYVTFKVAGGEEALTTWSLEIKDINGQKQYFGPFIKENASIPGKMILGTSPSGDFQVTMIGKTKSNKEIRRETSVHMVLWVPPTNEKVMRFSIIYEINESKAIAMYEKYLTEIVMPKIPKNGTVIIHGHTDIIGDENYNQNLSLKRAVDVKNILEKALSNVGRTDVKFKVQGFGEDNDLSPFENKYPEERFYNRTVVIDILYKD